MPVKTKSHRPDANAHFEYVGEDVQCDMSSTLRAAGYGYLLTASFGCADEHDGSLPLERWDDRRFVRRMQP